MRAIEMKLVVTAVVLASLSPSISFAATVRACKDVGVTLADAVTVSRKVIEQTTPVRNAVVEESFSEQWSRFQGAKSKLQDADATNVEEWVLASFFIDRPKSIEVVPAKNLITLWNNTGGMPARNFIRAFHEFIEVPRTSSGLIADWKSMHETLMLNRVKIGQVIDGKRSLGSWVKGLFSGNVEGISTKNVGKFRSGDVLFYDEIKNTEKYAHNRFLKPVLSPDRSSLMVMYPQVTRAEDFKDILSPEFMAEFERAPQKEALTEKFVTELVSWAFNQHEAKLAAAKTVEEKVAAHAELAQHLISIHPFPNGNGRSTRFLLSTLITSEGLPPPILRNTDDVQMTPETFAERVLDGVELSKAFLNDVTFRINNGLNPVESPVLKMAMLPTRIYFDTQQAKLNKQYFPVDAYDFAQFARMQGKPSFIKTQKYTQDTEHTRLREYVNYLKTWAAYNPKTMAPYQQRLVPDEMQQTFFRVDATNPDAWRAKKELFMRDEEVFRGLSTRSTMTDEQLLQYFVETQPIYLSMKSSGVRGDVRAGILSDFKAYNNLLMSPPKFFALAKDHMEATGQYATSPLLSTALDRRVADRFARGFLTSPDGILKMRGQLVVGAYLPKYGAVELNRLNPVANHSEVNFASKYPRQQEVSVAGALSVDSIKTLEFRDVEVKTVGENTGMAIAGDTVIHARRVLTRDETDPSIIHLVRYNDKNEVEGEVRFQMVKQGNTVTFKRLD